MIRVDVSRAAGGVRIESARVRRWVRATLRGEGIRRADLTVVFIDDRISRRLHRRWFGQDSATDVMAFPLGGGETLEGEVYVNSIRARRQAHRFGVRLQEELLRLVVHGTLHLAGYDDRSRGPAHRMRAREDVLVEQLSQRL
jgi:probable rRNA maturation factor